MSEMVTKYTARLNFTTSEELPPAEEKEKEVNKVEAFTPPSFDQLGLDCSFDWCPTEGEEIDWKEAEINLRDKYTLPEKPTIDNYGNVTIGFSDEIQQPDILSLVGDSVGKRRLESS